MFLIVLLIMWALECYSTGTLAVLIVSYLILE